VEPAPAVTDPLGRNGEAIGFPSVISGLSTYRTVVFDPETSRLLYWTEGWEGEPSFRTTVIVAQGGKFTTRERVEWPPSTAPLTTRTSGRSGAAALTPALTAAARSSMVSGTAPESPIERWLHRPLHESSVRDIFVIIDSNCRIWSAAR
jgi:hypothetical protein